MFENLDTVNCIANLQKDIAEAKAENQIVQIERQECYFGGFTVCDATEKLDHHFIDCIGTDAQIINAYNCNVDMMFCAIILNARNAHIACVIDSVIVHGNNCIIDCAINSTIIYPEQCTVKKTVHMPNALRY